MCNFFFLFPQLNNRSLSIVLPDAVFQKSYLILWNKDQIGQKQHASYAIACPWRDTAFCRGFYKIVPPDNCWVKKNDAIYSPRYQEKTWIIDKDGF